jgi:hypothetical protein
LADHLGVITRHIDIQSNGEKLRDHTQLLEFRSTRIQVSRLLVEEFSLRDSEGKEFKIPLEIGTTEVARLQSEVKKQVGPREFELCLFAQPLAQLPRPDRATIEVRYHDVELTFNVDEAHESRLIRRDRTFDDLRKDFAQSKSPELIAFLLDDDPVPLQQIVGSLPSPALIEVLRLESATFTVGNESFPTYSTVGQVRRKLRTDPKLRLEISDRRGVLPNSALLVQEPQLNHPRLPSEAGFSIHLAGDSVELDDNLVWDVDHTVDALRHYIARVVRSPADRIQIFAGRYELVDNDEYLCELGGVELSVHYKQPRAVPN